MVWKAAWTGYACADTVHGAIDWQVATPLLFPSPVTTDVLLPSGS